MDRQEWLDRWAQEFHALRQQFPTSDMIALQRKANAIMSEQYGPCPEGLGITDKIVRALALRWLRGKLADLRGSLKETGMGKVLKFLDGWKLVIGVAVLFGAHLWDGAHNGHTGDMIGNFLNIMGWQPTSGGFTPEGITVAAASATALIGFAAKLIKAGKQAYAGAPLSGLLSEAGYVAAAQKKAALPVTGTLESAQPAPPIPEADKGIGQPKA